MRRDEFASCHPIVNFAYFFVVLAFSMVFTHPVTLVISLGSALAYSAYLKGKKAFRILLFLIPMGVLTTLLNPLYNHEGATILYWLPNDNPLTLEAFFYGAGAALMLSAAVVWFACVNGVLTSDKFVWLFGRVLPALALVLSMALRFVPRFTQRLRLVSAARAGAGYGGGAGVLRKVKYGLSTLSIVVTWALENAIETADSMKNRGYGLPGRSAFSIYRWEKRDSALMAFLMYAAMYIILGSLWGGLRWQYYPTTTGEWSSPYTISIFLTYLALCLTPLYLNGKEALQWKSFTSGI